MDSLNDILNRVLQNSAEKVAQRVQPAMNRRPLRDPQTDTVGFFNDISAAVKNIRSPEAAQALQSQAISQVAVNDAGSQPGDSTNESPSSSPAANTRRTTIKDDANVIGEMTKAAAQIVQQVATAGKAIGDFGGNAKKFDKAITGMADSVKAADKDVQATKPTEGFVGWLKSLIGRTSGDSMPIKQNPATAYQKMAGAYQWGSYPKKDGFGWAPSSPADNAAVAKRPESKLDQWLNSSSLADGFRGLMAKIIPQRAQFTGGGPAVNMSGGSAASPGGAQDVNSVADMMAARAMNFFKRISRRPESERADDDQQEEDKNQQTQRTPSFFQNAAQSLTRTIGRQGRRILTKNFRQRVQRGQGLIRGRVRVMPAGGGGAGGAPPAANTALSWPRGMFGGGAAGGAGGSGAAGGAGAGGNAAGGAAGGRAAGGGFFGRMAGMFGGGGGGAAGGSGAAGGGGAAGGAALAGVALGFVALAAVVVVAVGALAKLGMQGYETALRVAQFDGQLSAAKAQLDVSRLMRDIGTARTLSEAGAGFMKSLDKLEAALRPITDGAMQIGMEFMIVVMDYVTIALQGLLKATFSVIKAFDAIENRLGMDLISQEMLKGLEDMANGRQNNAPQNIPAAGFHNEFLRQAVAAAPPRPPLPPLGGGNGN